MSPIDNLLMELEMEAATTKRVLERIPDEHLAWKPAEKSMTLAELAQHIADNPKMICGMITNDTYQVNPEFFANMPKAASREEAVQTLTDSVAYAKDYISGLTPEKLGEVCRLMKGDQELMAYPRGAIIRIIMLNHWYHHRGQLSVYLRLLGVAVPSIYGPSADENPFVKAAGAA
jgi:uncharacterized damage-inducible protein DinB